jgi:hypothetical protein
MFLPLHALSEHKTVVAQPILAHSPLDRSEKLTDGLLMTFTTGYFLLQH